VKLLISKLLLGKLAAGGGSAEADRRSRQAEGILRMSSGEEDLYGCERTSAQLPLESKFLVEALLRSGQLVALLERTGEISPTVDVDYRNELNSGSVTYSVQSHPLVSLRTWWRNVH